MEIKRVGVATRFSQCVSHNNTLYLCGQVAADTNADIKEQTRTMLENTEAVLNANGSGRDKILSATIYLRDMKDYAGMNEEWDAWLPEGHAPARTCVEARLARPDMLVEVTVVAARELI